MLIDQSRCCSCDCRWLFDDNWHFSSIFPIVCLLIETLSSEEMGHQLDEEQVSNYLKNHRGFLEEHVLEHIDVETLERWLIRRSQRDKCQSVKNNQETSRRISLSRWKVFVLFHSSYSWWFHLEWQFCVHADKRKMLQTLMNSLASKPQPNHILWELACCVASAVAADGFILHMVSPHSNRLRIFKRFHSVLVGCYFLWQLQFRFDLAATVRLISIMTQTMLMRIKMSTLLAPPWRLL